MNFSYFHFLSFSPPAANPRLLDHSLHTFMWGGSGQGALEGSSGGRQFSICSKRRGFYFSSLAFDAHLMGPLEAPAVKLESRLE